MSADRIQIEEMIVRIPGIAPGDVPALIDDVLRRVQDRLHGTGRCGELGLAELRVTVPPGGREALIDALVEGIAGVMR
jgi:hypothetical protein